MGFRYIFLQFLQPTFSTVCIFLLDFYNCLFCFLYLALHPPTDIHSLKSGLIFIKKSWYDFDRSHGVFHNLYDIRCFWRAFQMKKLHISSLWSLNNAVNINPWFFSYEIRKLAYSLNSMHKAIKLFEKRLPQTKKISINQRKNRKIIFLVDLWNA